MFIETSKIQLMPVRCINILASKHKMLKNIIYNTLILNYYTQHGNAINICTELSKAVYS